MIKITNVITNQHSLTQASTDGGQDNLGHYPRTLLAKVAPLLFWILWSFPIAAQPPASNYDYRVLATTRTGTMDKEMNEAADAGFVFGGVMGGQTAFGGKEVLVIMKKNASDTNITKRKYKLLATSRTGTMQKELQQAGDEGFAYCGLTVFESTFGGQEVSVILERDPAVPPSRIEYRLLATSRTGTMQKELQQAGGEGFVFRGVAIGKTKFGGAEVVTVLDRPSK